MSSSVRNILMLAIVTAVAGSITAIPESTTTQETISTAEGPGTGTGPAAVGNGAKGAQGQGSNAGPATGSGPGIGTSPGEIPGLDPSANDGLKCAAGQNGGNTDVGVSGDKIRLASTVVTSGPGSTFLGQSRLGMEAVVAKVNAAGGICGRQLDLTLTIDNWEAGRGHQTIRNWINGDYFALPVVPSSEGLAAASKDIEAAGIPVVGTDGMRIDQYFNPWIWPVASATVTQVRVMAKYAFDKGAKNFAIVYDTRYKFGVEGRDAYEEYVKTLPGGKFVHAEGIQPGQPGYGPEIRKLNSKCGANGCDAVVMLVDPGTAEVWISGDDNYVSRADFRMGASPLFNERFGQNCRERCDGMLVFTGYTPPLSANVNKPDIRSYVNDVQAISPSADVTNQFLEGAYLGMSAFVKAIQDVGPNLTRERLKTVLNTMTYTSDLSAPLSWAGPQRFANAQAQAWSIQAPSSFNGFRDERTGWLPDPTL